MTDKIKIGGFSGIVHTALALVLSIISFIDPKINGNALNWNILVFNAPVLIDFAHNLISTPREKQSDKFNSICWTILIGLGISVFISVLCIGVKCTIEDINTNIFASGIIYISYFLLKISFILNPIGVFLNYVCSILIEEHRRENNLENDNE